MTSPDKVALPVSSRPFPSLGRLARSLTDHVAASIKNFFEQKQVFDALPLELKTIVFSFVNGRDLGRLSKVSRAFRRIVLGSFRAEISLLNSLFQEKVRLNTTLQETRRARSCSLGDFSQMPLLDVCSVLDVAKTKLMMKVESKAKIARINRLIEGPIAKLEVPK